MDLLGSLWVWFLTESRVFSGKVLRIPLDFELTDCDKSHFHFFPHQSHVPDVLPARNFFLLQTEALCGRCIEFFSALVIVSLVSNWLSFMPEVPDLTTPVPFPLSFFPFVASFPGARPTCAPHWTRPLFDH